MVPPWGFNGFHDHAAVLSIDHLTITDVHPTWLILWRLPPKEDQITFLAWAYETF